MAGVSSATQRLAGAAPSNRRFTDEALAHFNLFPLSTPKLISRAVPIACRRMTHCDDMVRKVEKVDPRDAIAPGTTVRGRGPIGHSVTHAAPLSLTDIKVPISHR
jgi:hypothetical protein